MTSGRFSRQTRWGTTLLSGGPGGLRTRFRIWAPDSSGCGLEIEGRPAVEMRRSEDGWFEAEAPVGAGARYRFRVSPDMAVPDPASRLQAGDVHDPSVVVDPRAFEWRNADWRGRPWHETVLYEAHAGAMGGFKGVQAALPRLRDLGVTAV